MDFNELANFEDAHALDDEADGSDDESNASAAEYGFDDGDFAF